MWVFFIKMLNHLQPIRNEYDLTKCKLYQEYWFLYLCLGPYLCSTQYHSAQEEAPSISKKRLIFCQVKKSHKMFPLINLDHILCLHFNN